MLVLSRSKDESIIIWAYDSAGAPIAIDVAIVRIGHDKVRLGISAPDSIEVHRQEVAEEIARERMAAAELFEGQGTDADRERFQ